MNQRSLLRKFVAETLREGMFWKDTDDEIADRVSSKKEKSFFEKLKSFFGSNEFEAVVEEWVEDQEYYHDIDVPEKIQREAEEYLKLKRSKILSKAKGDEGRANALSRKLLDARFGKILKDIARQQDMDVEDEPRRRVKDEEV